MRFDIRPYHGAGPLAFGMQRLQVRKIMKYTKESPSATRDNYYSYNVLAHYDASSGELEAVEFYGKANVAFHDFEFLSKNFDECKKFMMRYDKSLRIDDESIISYEIGISIYAPDFKESPLDPIKTALIFRKGYYDAWK